jgi:hypothetical protein
MILFLIILLLLIAAFAIWKVNGSPSLGSTSERHQPARQQRPRFSGRVVEPRMPAASRVPRRAGSSRLRKTSQTVVRNGHAVTPPDAIGLACLAPISECKLGADCLCVSPDGRRGGSR